MRPRELVAGLERDGSRTALLLADVLPLIAHHANRIGRRAGRAEPQDLDDMVQAGLLGALQAVAKLRPGCSFKEASSFVARAGRWQASLELRRIRAGHRSTWEEAEPPGQWLPRWFQGGADVPRVEVKLDAAKALRLIPGRHLGVVLDHLEGRTGRELSDRTGRRSTQTWWSWTSGLRAARERML